MVFCKHNQKGTLNYKESTNNQFGSNEVDYIVYFNGGKSIEFGIPKKVIPRTEKISETEVHEISIVDFKKPCFVYKDLGFKRLFLGDFIGSKQFYITDTLNNFRWKVTPEHKKVFKYTCTKATLNFRGRNYIAWFTEQVPLPLGPWKFGGLPGLIVKITDTENKFDYELTGINLKAIFDNKIIAVPSEYAKDKSISHQQFIKTFAQKNADYSKMAKIVHSGVDGSYGSATIILPEKQEKF